MPCWPSLLAPDCTGHAAPLRALRHPACWLLWAGWASLEVHPSRPEERRVRAQACDMPLTAVHDTLADASVELCQGYIDYLWGSV